MNRSSSVAFPFLRLQATGRTIIRGVSGLVRTFRHRKDAAMLVGFDERMLADIGLTRSDLRDAFAQPLWRDPTTVLVDRACERRTNRPRLTFASNGRVTAPSSVPVQPRASSARAA